MKIAIQNPLFLFSDPAKNFNGYNLSFFKKYVSYIYLTRPWHICKYKARIRDLKLNPEQYEFIYRLKTLNNKADALLGFDGEPYHRTRTPPKGFNGLKAWHVMDYVFKAQESADLLAKNGVTVLMGYAKHDLHCPFFKNIYKNFIGKVIPIPFGYGQRFKNLSPFEDRANRCVAMGAVNPVNDPMCPPGTIDEYVKFYNGMSWTHELRRKIASEAHHLKGVDSFLPLFPETKNAAVDPVKELNRYQMYVNDEGLLNFPPARTYEGIATGCVMVASKNPIYDELGFVDGINYIAFERNNLDDFQSKVLSYQEAPHKLQQLHAGALQLAEKYSHDNIAEAFYQQLIAF